MKQLFTLVFCLFLTSALTAQNVGIGTTSPVVNLDVKDPVEVPPGITPPINLLHLVRDGQNGTKWDLSAGIGIGSYATGINSQTRLDISLGNGPSNIPDALIMTMLGNGMVGIGTNSPMSKLDILGSGSGIRLLSGATGNFTSFQIGRTIVEATLGVAALNSNYAVGSVPGDVILRTETTANSLILNSGAGAATLIVKDGKVGINAVNPNPSAILDISSTNKGLLIPRMTSAQRIAIGSPVQGLEVFDTTTGTFWYYTGSEWQNVSGVVSGPKDIIEFAATGTTTWVCPAGVYSAVVEMWGSGGGGGGGGSVGSGTGTCPPPGGTGTGGSSGGGTGGGGGYIRDVISVTPGVSYTIRIGAGGAGGAINANGVTGGITDIKQASTILVAISGGTGGAKGNATSGTCTIDGGVGGTGGVVTGAGLKRNGRTGYDGADSTLATGPGGACICGVTNSTTSSPKLDGPPSYKGSFEGPLNVGVGGDGGKGAANANFNTSGDAGGQGYLILTLY